VQDQSGLVPPVRSNFVTVLAWIFIAFAGFATFIALLQNVMINLMLPLDDIHMRASMDAAKMPAFFAFAIDHLRWFFLIFLLVSATTLVAAIGLLRRWNWARLVFVAILGLGIVWNIGGIALQQVMMSSMPMPPPNAPKDIAHGFDVMAKIIVIFSALMGIGFSVLYGWLIQKLFSPAIRSEFS
jgi:hypothetical protein